MAKCPEPRYRGGMKLLALLLVALPALASADVTIIDNGKTVAIDCAKDPQVDLIGNHLTVTLTGTCTKLNITGNHETVTGSATDVSVMGNENSVALDATDKIMVAGNKNTVSWKQPGTKVQNSGKDNTVTQLK